MQRISLEVYDEACRFLAEGKTTIRKAAKRYKISKSALHRYIKVKLEEENSTLYHRVEEVVATNKNERAIRGGNATKENYAKMK